ncbi:MAG: thiamine diphosphokinase [candidate division Zixibacteria bacterium]|nr:thiamine diphosphokinase [candidate division Zixibacteria bacterium]
MSAFVFLNGHYYKNDACLVRHSITSERRKPTIIAVDGGIKFLQRVDTRPDYWVTDLDSAPKIKKGFLSGTELFVYPSDKDKTDTELALDLCVTKNMKSVKLFGWYDANGETDHLLGNLFLGINPAFSCQLSLEFINSRQTVIPIHRGRITIRNKKGYGLSVLPIQGETRVSLSGVKYKARQLSVFPGQTKSLRNVITAQKAIVEVTAPVLVILSS